MKVHLLRMLLTGYFAFLLAGCSQAAVTNASETPTPLAAETAAIPETQRIPTMSRQDDDMPRDPHVPIPAISGLQPLVEKAKADLAQRLSIPVSRINAIEAKGVFWPDASLGCPQSDTTYTQVLTPGYLILLESGGSKFEYHANLNNYVIYCENPTPPILETPANP
jgi:hypothetical protein